eukprot:COSAG01_NODE_31111_length_603_cov_2.434524_1_plen_91_part_00
MPRPLFHSTHAPRTRTHGTKALLLHYPWNKLFFAGSSTQADADICRSMQRLRLLQPYAAHIGHCHCWPESSAADFLPGLRFFICAGQFYL